MGGVVLVRGIAQVAVDKLGQKNWWAGASAHAAFAAGAASRLKCVGWRRNIIKTYLLETTLKEIGIRIMVLFEAQSSDVLSQWTFEGWGVQAKRRSRAAKIGRDGASPNSSPRSADRTGSFGGDRMGRRSGAKKLGWCGRELAPGGRHPAPREPHRSRIATEATSRGSR